MKKFMTIVLTLLMVLGVAGGASASAVCSFDLPGSSFDIGDTISVGLVLTSDTSIALQSGGGWFDFDETFMTYSSYDASSQFPVPVVNLESDSDWYTFAGWTAKGYTAPSFFEEGPDLIVATIGSIFAPTGTVFDLGTFNFTALVAGDAGDILVSFLDRPNTDDFVLSSGDVLDPIQCTTVPIPGALYLLGSGLFGLLGIRRKLNS